MRTSSSALLLFTALGLASASGQEAKPPAKTAQAPKKDKEKPDQVPGYKMVKVEGFTFLISQDALARDVSKYDRKPMDVLELECKTLAKILTPQALNLLRRLTVWVEWDEPVKPRANRPGVTVLATYSPLTAVEEAQDGRHPLRAKTVTIHSLRALTESRQPKIDTGDCLLLHEFAHAVHDQLLGSDHAGINAAYRQAMERKLYDREAYASTNAHEFFAELTCAYLDRLGYYPHTRADLKKHDPVTYKLMESVWGTAAAKTTDTAKGAAPAPAKYDLTLAADVKLGTALAGDAPTPDRLRGKVVLIAYWGAEFSNVLNRVERLNDELGPYGLVVLAPHSYDVPAAEVKAEAARRVEGLTVLEEAFVRDGDAFKSSPGGQALLFDHTGQCIFRGLAYDADKPVRAAVGRMMVGAATGGKDVPAGLKLVADAVAAGTAPVGLLPKLNPLASSADPAVKEVAKKLTELILAPGQKLLDDAQSSVKSDPVGAYIGAERVAAGFKNTALAPRATALMTSLRADRAVATELKARTSLAQVQKLVTQLQGSDGAASPSDERFQATNRAAIAQLRSVVEQMRKQFPTARATAQAEKMAREFTGN
jgi:hypothetical protein